MTPPVVCDTSKILNAPEAVEAGARATELGLNLSEVAGGRATAV